ncbi:hypothetical protein TSUD_364210 [Trifolium subterraneum]|uniref:Uncharacterized protein n=1 Tax=Trifolium subterraneum TaxID=3900 RepID=A0A2Z6N5F0_TRISU|nr:hypothetical protein TSUD_364210 [Trifolium subterraneum]
MEHNSTNDGGPAMNLQAAVGEINRLKAKMTAMEQEKVAEREEEAELDNIKDSQPLAQALWDAQIPANFKIPQLPTFEGKADPLENLMTVGTQIAIIGAEEHLKCKLLSSTFKDAALRWYMNLPRNSIASYTYFHKKFIHQFAGSKHVQVTSTSLFGIRQGHNENLREYLARFNEATIQVSNPNQEMFVAAVQNGLKVGHLNESLAQKPGSTMQEVMKMEECYIKGEESNAEKRCRDSREKPSSRRSPERYHKRNNQRSGRYEDKGRLARLPPAPDNNARMGPNENAWCHYHRVKGHDTEKCYCRRIRERRRVQSSQKAIPQEDHPGNEHGGTCFGGEQVEVMGHVTLLTTFGEKDNAKTIKVRYLVVKTAFTSYNIIIGRPTFNTLGAVMSTLYLSMKYPLDDGRIGTVRGDQAQRPQCYELSLRLKRNHAPADQPIISRVNMISRENMVETSDLDPREEFQDRRVNPIKDLEPIQIGEAPHELTNLETHLDEGEKEKIIEILRKNVDLFAWKPSDMLGIDESVITHKLAISPNSKPVSQRKRNIKYPEWLANVVLVKKSNGKWRMCVDFTDLNKACPKDLYPLPSIDKLIDGASGYKTLSFMDAYSGYNQIKMNTLDAPHTTFMSNTCNYHYTVMPFSLKNVGATYQRLMDRVFAHQIRKNLEVYIDDMVVKTTSKGEHHEDLKDIMASVRKYNMRLNLTKCSFGVQADMRSPTSVKEVQQLTGRITALSRFLSCAGEKAFHFFATLKSGERFTWSDKCEEAFQQLKVFLASPSILTRPQLGSPLYLYLIVSKNSMCSALVQDIKGEERPVYFVSRIFRGSEIRYQKIEKLSLAVVTTARRLRHYFQSHKIVVKTDHPIKHVLKKPDLAGRMVAWAVELSEYDITFVPRGNIKPQILADFILELSSPPEATNMQPWTLSVDGASNIRGSGPWVVLEGPDGVLIEQSLRFAFKASNNQAEYEALIAGMRLAKEMEVADLRAKSDSQLVTSQVPGEFQAKDPQLIKYLEQLSEEKEERVKIKKMAAHYTMVGGELYKRGFSSPMLLCVGETKSRRILNEIHNGSCGSHIGGRSLAGKVTRAGFFWPTLLSDANRHVRSCDQCQRHADLHHAPGEPLQSVMSPWPFYMWGVDILGSFTTSQGFRIPKYIVSDNGTQFTSESVINFCQEKGICNTFISVEHPQANGQAESANKVILRAIKRRLEGKDKNWVEHLLPTLWSYHTTIHSSTGETPFKMVYGADAMIPAEVDPPSWRIATLTAEVNSEALKENLDLLEEVRETAHFREFTVKQRASRKYNTRVMAREFREGDLILKRSMGRNKGGKLAPNWEGSYRIQEALGGGAYRLETLKGGTLPRAWNVINLRFYYS